MWMVHFFNSMPFGEKSVYTYDAMECGRLTFGRDVLIKVVETYFWNF